MSDFWIFAFNPIGSIVMFVGLGLAVRFLFVRQYLAAGASGLVAVLIPFVSF